METATAATINPFAGMHPVTASAVELEAARRAAEISIRETPYYVERFGERGRLFGASDGGWLITLCHADADFARRQVTWLGHVLACRGMPRWLLRRHLEILHGELERLEPGHAGCRVLLDAAALLHTLQHEHLPEPEARDLAADFDRRADPAWVARLPGMGRILVAAVADEADGIDRAVERVTEWAADPGRFPERWIAAVTHTVAEARRRVRSAS